MPLRYRVFIFLGIVWILFSIVKFFLDKIFDKIRNANIKDDVGEEKIDYTDFEDKMIDQVQDGKKYQHFLNIGNRADCALIRSMLSSADIYSYTENEKVNTLYGGFAGTINQMFCIKLYILTDDYEEALEIVSDFIKSKIARLSKKSDKSKFEKTLKTLAKIAAAPYLVDKEDELLGITIMPKEKESLREE